MICHVERDTAHKAVTDSLAPTGLFPQALSLKVLFLLVSYLIVIPAFTISAREPLEQTTLDLQRQQNSSTSAHLVPVQLKSFRMYHLYHPYLNNTRA